MSDVSPRGVIAAIDKVLSDRPKRDSHHFSEANRLLAGLRDALIRLRRLHSADADSAKLQTVNAALSVMLGGQFPLGEVPWVTIKLARDQLATMLPDSEHS